METLNQRYLIHRLGLIPCLATPSRPGGVEDVRRIVRIQPHLQLTCFLHHPLAGRFNPIWVTASCYKEEGLAFQAWDWIGARGAERGGTLSSGPRTGRRDTRYVEDTRF